MRRDGRQDLGLRVSNEGAVVTREIKSLGFTSIQGLGFRVDLATSTPLSVWSSGMKGSGLKAHVM